MSYIFNPLLVLIYFFQVNAAITDLAPRVSAKKRMTYSAHIAINSYVEDLDPLRVVAIMDRESSFRARVISSTNDYGLMQVHWQRGPWMNGLSRRDLLNPAINIRAGIGELVHIRNRCDNRRGHGGHHWIGHYKWGNVVKTRSYERKILRTYRRLLTGEKSSKTKGRYRRKNQRPDKS